MANIIDNDIKEYLGQYMVNAALRAGAAIMGVYNSNKEADLSPQSDEASISIANCAAHTAIKECLGPTRIPILSEEGREMLYDERRSWEMFWLVDPLDGTLEFVNKGHEFTVNIALMSGNRAIAGLIFIPCLNQLYIASKGDGAYLREGIEPDESAEMSYQQICEGMVKLPRLAQPHERQRVAVSRSHITPETNSHIEQLRSTHPDLEVIEQGSSYKFCMLAEGDIDYYVRTSSTYEWDTAAGEFVLAEAGGVTSSLESEESLKYNKEELHNPWFKCRSALSKIK